MKSFSLKVNEGLPTWLVLVLATSIGVIAANIYYAQPLIALISKSLGIPPESAGLVMMLTQIGYGTGVLFLVPLGDILESRKLVITLIGLTIISLLCLAYSSNPLTYFMAAFATGLGSSGVQVIVPYAAHFSSPEKRGRVIGSMTTGLTLGIMLSRPIASVLADYVSWHAVFILSALLMTLIGTTLFFLLPPKPPMGIKSNYFVFLKSMGHLFYNEPLLRKRSLYQGLLFCTFCFFWTASPLLLAGNDFKFTQSMIAIFAFVGVSGAIAAPLAGRAADKGWINPATALLMIGSALSYVISNIFPLGTAFSLATLVLAAFLLDAGAAGNLVLGQRAIFELGAEFRGRLNAIYIASTFLGGALGSFLGAWAYAKGGWILTSRVGFIMPGIALVFFAYEMLAQKKNTIVRRTT